MYVEIYSERLNDSTRGKTSCAYGFERTTKLSITTSNELRISYTYADDTMGDGSRGGEDRTMYRRVAVDIDPDEFRRLIDFAIGNQFIAYAESDASERLRAVLEDTLIYNSALKRENELLKQRIEQAVALLNTSEHE